ncbi:hypothetical protein GQ53DRAFT_543802 [Thozetella sp. PMI_491]|nr:hypothetical protein GQ53DRAFT_543802 [Thozetella sp. PMI_491]
MASPAVAVAQVNGVAAPSRPDSPMSINSSTKRKRDASEDSTAEINGNQTTKPAINGYYKTQDQKTLIRDFYDVLRSYEPAGLDILRRPLPVNEAADGEPQLKRTKSEDTTKPSSIASKVSGDDYGILDDLVSDVVEVTKALLKDSASPQLKDGTCADRDTVFKLTNFQSKILELYRRELAYPQTDKTLTGRSDLQHGDPAGVNDAFVLSAYGMIPKLKPVYSSLQRAVTSDIPLKPLSDTSLPNGVAITRLRQTMPASTDKNGRPLTLGDLFPSPRNLPPLQPPKATKNTTKNNVLTFYHPELTEKSKYRPNTYFSQEVTTGHWLDYSNATPTMHGKTKQRERAQSLAGVKPSSIELEMSEMEALFRGAFSSFAPSKDDSAAIVPSGQVSRMWWQRVGRLNLEKMIDAEAPEEEAEDGESGPVQDEIDEELVKSAIENWDDAMVDPTLDQALGNKAEEDKEVDDLLEEVSDLIETLASYQRNRNLTLPTSQDRYSADPVNGDLLRNGNASHQPGDEELATYQALKAQLSLIIKTLPPYAVARLNSDKLEDLNVSSRIEIRTDEYRGVMEDDEPARLAKQNAQAAASTNQRSAHRTPSVPSPAPYASPQYGTPQYAGMNRPMPNAQHYPQTPVRAQAPNMYTQRPPSAVPISQPHQAQPRPPPPQQYRPASFGGYAAQLAKHQGPHGHSPMPQYQGTPSPGPARMSPHQPGYANLPQAGTPNQRYPPSGYPGNYPQHQQMHPQHHQQHPQHPPQHPQHHVQHPQHAQHAQHHAPPANYSPYTNGGQMPRTMSPQMPQAHGYGPSQSLPQHQQHAPRPPYGSPAAGMMPGPAQRHYSGPAGMPPGANPGLTGYHTVMPEVQQRQVMEQARARLGAQQSATGHMGKVTQGEIAGLAGIGLGGPVDINKIAAQRAMQVGNTMSPNARPPMASPVNGTAHGPPPSPSPVSVHANSASPVAGVGFQPPHA